MLIYNLDNVEPLILTDSVCANEKNEKRKSKAVTMLNFMGGGG